MALSNHEKIRIALFDQLVPGLRPFVDAHLNAKVPNGDWVSLYAARERANGGRGEVNPDDPALLLKVLTEDWRAFEKSLNRAQSALATEVRQVRNDFAHNKQFTSDDTYRALDSIERLLLAVGVPEQAAAVGKLRQDHQRQVYEDSTRHRAKTAATVVNVPGVRSGQSIKPWREIVTPHEDVSSGQFNAAEFAADLHQVATGQQNAPEYADPREFFARTYLTSGLRDLLGWAARRISGDANASPVVNLQTQFGGGKTHSMLALYHLFSGVAPQALPQGVQEVLASAAPEGAAPSWPADLTVNRVTLVGTHLSPSQPLVKSDGTQVRTLWGELAWQLGGRDAYERVRAADEAGVPPGDALADLVRDHAPALILIDEWVAYARLLVDAERALPGGTFDAQFTFAQHLTELVRAIPGVMLVVSIPASDTLDAGGVGSALEVGGPNGRVALERLQHVVGRTADDWRPASSAESFEIVRRRLFTEPDGVARADVAAVARQYAMFYQEHTGSFPRETTKGEYEERIRSAYPIHPELFDRLYQDWSTLEKFQRTRGVLRLMSVVIHSLWASGDAAPLIAPGTVPVADSRVFSELTKYLPDNWKPIVDSDVDGEGSTPVRIDAERPAFGSRALTRRIARSAFLASAPTLGTSHRGVDKQRLWLGTAVPGDTVGHFGDALELLAQRATYLYDESGRYWYDTTASVTKQAADRADRLREEPETVYAAIVERLRANVAGRPGLFAAVHVGVRDTGDVPDGEDVRLVLAHPTIAHAKDASTAREFTAELMATAGRAQRQRRNTVVVVAPDRARMEELEAAVRDQLAWEGIVASATSLDLRPQQVEQARARARTAAETVGSRLTGAYVHVLVPEQPDPGSPATVGASRVSDGAGSIAERVADKLRRGDQLADVYAPARIRMALEGPLQTLWSQGHVSAGTLWSLYTTYPYLDRLRSRRVLEEAILAVANSLVWQVEGFALADSFDGERYVGLWLPGDVPEPAGVTDSTLLVRADRALAQRAADEAARAAAQADPPDPRGEPSAGTSAADEPPTGLGAAVPQPPERRVAPRAVPRGFFGSKALDPQRYAKDFSTVVAEVLQHLAAVDGVELSVRLEISATAPDGFSEQVVRTVRENANQLRFEQSGFEE
ncbi:Swt1 family HEPN domain-containing protein [Miniimonas sp. S16]|uniref:Swt1 family HEPN domain-containing protein n=1 Tax=Miniimonas sp. S16 TaxID=2171623 RepID=UPI000D52A413|nr:Swt1 family HEPN domain-containing protein [Miniimonas sp. S16]